MRLSRRIQEIQPSPTLGVTARANALKAAGEKVFSFAAGEPDFPTPEHICKAAFRAIESGKPAIPLRRASPPYARQYAERTSRRSACNTAWTR